MSASLASAPSGTRVLVTGGCGFIGTHLVRALLPAGARVSVIDDGSTGDPARLAGLPITLTIGSILDPAALRAAIDKAEVVLHLAAQVSVPKSVASPVETWQVNTEGTLRVLEAARAQGVRRVVFASTCAVYGPAPRLPSREEDPVDTASPYAATKAAGEALMAAWAPCYALETVVLRLFNVIGPGQSLDGGYAAVVPAFLHAARHGRPMHLMGGGGQTRDFVAVDDVVRAFMLAATREAPFAGEIINIGSGRAISIRDLAEIIGRVTGSAVRPTEAPARPGDVPHARAAIDRAREALGWQPTAALEDVLARAWADLS